MEQQLIRRVELIINFSPSLSKRNYTPDKEYTSSAIMQFFSLLCILMALFCIWLAIKAILNIEESNINWSSSSMLILMSFINLLMTPRNFADFLLKRHMMDIIKKKPKIDDKANNKLKEAIALITDRKTNLQYLSLPMILIIGALLVILKLNPIWHLFAYLAPVSLIMIIIKSVKNHKIIKSCITNNETK